MARKQTAGGSRPRQIHPPQRPQRHDRAQQHMTERPTRPILHLKGAPAPAPKAVSAEWRCKPCGAAVEIDPSLDDMDLVRCPGCGASLGRAGQFRSDPPQLQRVRARRV